MYKTVRTLLGGLSLMMLMAACGDDGINVTKSSELQISPENVVFNRLSVGQKEVKSIQVRVEGEKNMRVTRIELAGAAECDHVKQGIGPADLLPADIAPNCPYTIIARPELPIDMQPGEFRNVDVKYQPRSDETPPPIQLIIETNATFNTVNHDGGDVTVGFSVQMVNPEIAVDPTGIQFQPTPPGSDEQEVAILIKNVGTGDLNVSTVALRLISEVARDPETQEAVDEFALRFDGALPWFIGARDAATMFISYNAYDEQGNTPDEAELVITSNDEQQPSLVIPVTTGSFGEATLRVTPNPGVFEEPAPGAASNVVLSFTNPSTVFVDVTDISLEQSATDYSLGAEQRSFRLQAGASREVNVTYQPLTAEGSNATLVVTTTATNAIEGSIRIPLVREGQIIPNSVVLTPAAYTFVGVGEREMDTKTIVVTNPNEGPITIMVGLSGDGVGDIPATDPQFTIINGDGEATLAPGDSRDVEVQFSRPDGDLNDHLGALVISGDDLPEPASCLLTAPAP